MASASELMAKTRQKAIGAKDMVADIGEASTAASASAATGLRGGLAEAARMAAGGRDKVNQAMESSGVSGKLRCSLFISASLHL